MFITANSSPKMDPAEFIFCLKAALLDTDITSQLQSVLSPAIDDLKTEISNLKDTISTKDIEIAKLREELEEIKQNEKGRTLKIDGLSESVQESDQNAEVYTKETVCNFVNKSLKVPLEPWEIDTCFRVGKKSSPDNKPRRVIVQLLTQNKKKKILAMKKNLRQEKDPIYINEDLIPTRAEIFKTARENVKDGRLHRAWIYQGQVFIKKNPDSEQTVIKSLSFLNMVCT